MAVAKVSDKGWVVIPKDIRKKYGLGPGSRVSFVDFDGHIYIVPVPADPVSALKGMLAGPGPSMTEELLKERRLDREKEDAKFGA